MINKTNTPIFDELIAKYTASPDRDAPDMSEHPTVQKDLGVTALENVAPQIDSTPKIEVSDYLSPTAKHMLDAMNEAIENGETTVNGDPFRMYIARAMHDSGYITPLEGKALQRGLELHERSKRRLI